MGRYGWGCTDATDATDARFEGRAPSDAAYTDATDARGFETDLLHEKPQESKRAVGPVVTVSPGGMVTTGPTALHGHTSLVRTMVTTEPTAPCLTTQRGGKRVAPMPAAAKVHWKFHRSQERRAG